MSTRRSNLQNIKNADNGFLTLERQINMWLGIVLFKDYPLPFLTVTTKITKGNIGKNIQQNQSLLYYIIPMKWSSKQR